MEKTLCYHSSALEGVMDRKPWAPRIDVSAASSLVFSAVDSFDHLMPMPLSWKGID